MSNYYELEKVRYWFNRRTEEETVLQTSTDYNELLEVANKLKLKTGLTFTEKITIKEWAGEPEEVIDVPYVRWVKEEI